MPATDRQPVCNRSGAPSHLRLLQARIIGFLRAWAFSATGLEGRLVIPAKLTKIGPSAFADTKLTHLDLSKAPSLAKIGDGVFRGTGS